jgi:transglutaminase-like putative cysteine protease
MTALRRIGCLTTIVCLCLTQNYCAAQDKSPVQFGKVGPADFVVPASPIIDSNTNAVILTDIGSVHFVGNNHSWFSYVYKRQTRIKILNKKAFGDLATVTIPLYKQDDDPEKVDNLFASTYNLENGQVVETKLDKNDVFEDKLDKNRFEKKFTLPAVKEGSIIEYTYTITSDYDFDLPSWEFQRQEYPCLWSEHQVKIPQTLSYVLVRQGVHAYAVDKGSEGSESYKMTKQPDPGSLGGQPEDLIVSANTIMHRWVMKDIPAFRGERYLSTPANYLDKIDFQLAKTYDGQEFHDHKNSWKQATQELLTQDDFGATLDEDNYLINDKATEITAGSADPLEQAKSIYYFVSGHFTCDNYYNKYLKTNLRDVMKKNGGSVGDINLLLIALLRKKGLQADPVVLSTREYGFNLASYPVLQKLNYVIVRLKIYDKVYYLDAAHSQLGFGQLAGDCYNGHARIISNKDSGSVFFETDSLREKKTTMVLITSTDKGLEGSWQSTFGQQESYELRRKMSGKDEKDYFSNIQTGYGEDMEISNGGIDSLLRREDPVKVHYDFRLHQTDGESRIYLNPNIGDGLKENPFKAEERKYPVEMPYVMDNIYIFSLEIPEGYIVEELPKSAKVELNGDQGLFEYLLGQQGNVIQLRCRLRLNKANFPPDDYTNLRDFFGFIVKKESETIVLKKK